MSNWYGELSGLSSKLRFGLLLAIHIPCSSFYYERFAFTINKSKTNIEKTTTM